jgi:MFS family permease
VPSNLILLKVGARRWIARIMVTWGLISAAMMFVSTPTQFYVVRFLLGVAEAGFFPAILLYLTYWFPAGRRSKVTALFMTGIPMSGVLGGPLSGWIMHAMSGAHGLAGWQWLFLLEGVPTVIVGIVAFFYLDDKVSDARWLNDEEKATIEADLQAEAGHHKLHSLRDGLASPRVLLLSAIYFFFTMGLYGVSFWLPSLVKASGVSNPLHVGLLSAVPYAAAAITMVLVGRSSDRHGERRWHLAVPGVLGALALCASVVCISRRSRSRTSFARITKAMSSKANTRSIARASCCMPPCMRCIRTSSRCATRIPSTAPHSRRSASSSIPSARTPPRSSKTTW